jgi:glutamate formiminotransferase
VTTATIEAVPNISDAEHPELIARATSAIKAHARLLDYHGDADHNRSVFTIAGAPDDVTRAMHALSDVVIAGIDLRTQQGVHPRVGALDVVPFVPVAGVSLDDCVEIARDFAAAFAARHDVPVFLYEAAATRPERRRLEAIRRGGLDGLAGRMRNDDGWRPDFGPAAPHPTAGVTVVGARVPLIAWNINLDSDRVDIASAIARRIRESSGGLPCVKALGVPLAARGLAQVTMNLTDYRVTSMRTVFDAVSREAARHGVGVRDSEVVGLVPRAAMSDDDARVLRVRDYNTRMILEERLAQPD